MNTAISGPEHFSQPLEIPCAPPAVRDAGHLPVDGDAVESVKLHRRRISPAGGQAAGKALAQYAAAKSLRGRKDKPALSRLPEDPIQGEYQLEVYLSGGAKTRVHMPRMDLRDAQTWSARQIDSADASFAAIYIPEYGSDRFGSGSLVSNYNRDVGWYL
ncbi:hypothetical protein LVY72_14715 [Arthrobacter sp. I2-34]|uniref:Uncharacterized protein n=1 Tax=Arthrobacter hankyongi TaxID=2904801 RepID=A0ABS9L9F5_9MICC|nr:hypothetical protein [Arthrobacter hankyongi]MCG2623148.1 hypothetical protein [Arthrobacter hankyongi]